MGFRAVWVVVGVIPTVVWTVVDQTDAAVPKFGEWWVEGGPFDAVGSDEQPAEECLVERSSFLIAAAGVEPVALFEQLQGDLEPLFGQFVVGAGCGDQPFGFALFDGDGFLALFEIDNRKGFGEVGVNELLALAFQFQDAGFLGAQQGLVLGAHSSKFGSDRFADGVDEFGVEPEAGPVPDDESFDFLDRQIGLLAVGALLRPPDAEEVGVDGAPSAFGVRQSEPRAAGGAEEAAFEVVVMAPGAVPGQAAAGEDVLDVPPGDGVNERFVGAVVDGAIESQLAQVVGARQDPVHHGPGQRLGRPGGRGSGAHPALGEFVDQVGDRVVAGGVAVERPLDVRGPFGVEADGLDLVLVDAGAGVEVAEWGRSRVCRRGELSRAGPSSPQWRGSSSRTRRSRP
ncbi:MAG: hypothetical protein WDN27_06370 [Candidatus Saccharibacteria bacterium]